MMQKAAIFVVGAVLGGSVVWWYLLNIQADWAEREAFIEPAGAVSESVMLLELLHSGKTDAAIESLEISLDSGLIGLSLYNPDELPSAQHHLIGRTLSRAKEYRSIHPRTNDSSEVEASIQQALRNAQ